MPRLLLVEDDPSNRLTASALLEDAGYEVVEAETYDEAERLLRAQPFDAVVLDRGLGDRDGVALAPLARAALPNAAVIVVSGADAEPHQDRNVDAWLVKGGSIALLLDALELARGAAARLRLAAR